MDKKYVAYAGSYTHESSKGCLLYTSATNMCHLPKDSLSISCEATNCIYNTNKKCDADHVDISGIKAVTEDDTVCTTFQARG